MAQDNLNRDQAAARIRAAVTQDLLSGRISLLLGWQKGLFWWRSRPLFARSQQDLERLVWDSFCAVNLSRYLPEELSIEERVGILVKGCDARAFHRLLQDRMLDRERVLLYGLPCPGMLDYRLLAEAGVKEAEQMLEEGEELVIQTGGGEERRPRTDFLLEKCRLCPHPDPVVYDQLLLPPGEPWMDPASRFQDLEARERPTPAERYAYWSGELQRCLSCYACRQVCPACSCRECFAEQQEPRWLGKGAGLNENMLFHIIRVYHGAGRCIECGECQRACPVGIPLLELSRRLAKDIEELYGPYEAGMDPEAPPPLLTYRPEDPAAFPEK